MEKLMLAGVEIKFNDFREEVQEKLYLQNKAMFEKDAAKSQYSNIRKLVIMDENSSSETLDEVFKEETENYEDIQNIELLLKHSNLERINEKLNILAESCEWEERVIAAKEETDSTKLNTMFREEVKWQNERNVKVAIRENHNFQIEQETIDVLANSYDWVDRVIAAEKETDPTKLNAMFRREVKGENDEDVKVAIRENCNFRIVQQTIDVLANSYDWQNRIIAAEEETDSSNLNEMLRKEVQGSNIKDVKVAIIGNRNFQIEQETIDVLANSYDWEDRSIAAKAKKILQS